MKRSASARTARADAPRERPRWRCGGARRPVRPPPPASERSHPAVLSRPDADVVRLRPRRAPLARRDCWLGIRRGKRWPGVGWRTRSAAL